MTPTGGTCSSFIFCHTHFYNTVCKLLVLYCCWNSQGIQKVPSITCIFYSPTGLAVSQSHRRQLNPSKHFWCPLRRQFMSVVEYVHSCHPSSVLVAVSEGSSSGILLSYLGECGSGTYLTAAADISPVLLGQLWFETVMLPIYRWGALFQRKLSFRTVLDVDRVLSLSSLRAFEETKSTTSDPAKDWDSYWERNEPLRDADEVAVPVLCICSRDNPLLPPASTLPITLFQSNPYFFLVLTEKGGHCGFNIGDKGCWSHTAVLGFFRVVADFLKGEEQDLGILASSRGEYNLFGRPRPQGNVQSNIDAEEVNFTWKRSYTR
uniref:Abhydrolase domain containing 15a n=1 Tax=Cynoglossus semilaevis TaxID=244447 RepID=A0A3P8W121_CYNSE